MESAGVDRMVLTHHDPMRTDEALDEILDNVRRAAQDRGIPAEKIMMAHEGMEISV